jgi:hypothetical protein
MMQGGFGGLNIPTFTGRYLSNWFCISAVFLKFWKLPCTLATKFSSLQVRGQPVRSGIFEIMAEVGPG